MTLSLGRAKSHAKIDRGKVVILLSLVYTSDRKKIAQRRVLVGLYIALLLNNTNCQASLAVTSSDKGPALQKEEAKAASEVLSAEIEVDSDKDRKADLNKTVVDKPVLAKPFTDKPISEANLMVDNIKVEGNRLVSTEDIMQVVKTKPGDRFNRDTVMEDLKAINGLGYFDERNLQVLPELNDGRVLLKIRVTENAPITQFAFSGNKVLDSQEITKIFNEQMGKPQNLSALSSAIDKVEQSYHEKGYVLARVTDVRNDPDGTIGLNINEGEIEKIEITGNKKTKDFIIRQAIKIKPGMVYSEKSLTNDLRKLFANGYFQDIRRSLVPSPNNPDKYILKVEVDEKRSGSLGLGGGIDTLAGPFGSFTLSDNNFRGRGESISLSSQVGTGFFGSVSNTLNNGGVGFVPNMRTYQLQAEYAVPNVGGTNTNMTVSGFGRDMGSFMIQQSMQRTLGASVNFTRSLGKNFNANLGFMGENTALRDVGSFYNNQNILTSMTSRALETGLASTPAQAAMLAGGVRKDQLTGGCFFTVNPSVSYDTRDAPMDATKGTLVRLSASPSLGLANASFAKFGLSASKYMKINEKMTFATNIQGGASLGNMPQFAQYYMGGWNGVRGYRSFTDLGTGTSMLMATAEVRSRMPFLGSIDNKFIKAIDRNLKGVIFADAGQVRGNSLTNDLLSRSYLGAAVGVGVRVRVPMLGIVRLDYGFPLISSVMGRYTPRLTVGFGDKF
jgi:outer membrane protein insertion porin family